MPIRPGVVVPGGSGLIGSPSWQSQTGRVWDIDLLRCRTPQLGAEPLRNSVGSQAERQGGPRLGPSERPSKLQNRVVFGTMSWVMFLLNLTYTSKLIEPMDESGLEITLLLTPIWSPIPWTPHFGDWSQLRIPMHAQGNSSPTSPDSFSPTSLPHWAFPSRRSEGFPPQAERVLPPNA